MLELAGQVETLLGRPLGDAEPIAAAVSGGPDSLALLILAQQAYGSRVRAVTVDHGLRPESAAEAQAVASICRDLGVSHAILRWEGDKPAANRQAAAREARYRLMTDWCRGQGICWLMTAHHADDQAETLLMRLARGAGLAGLAGVRGRRALGEGVTLLRPLLDRRRNELAAIVADHRLEAVDDPTNRDDRYDRTRARRCLAEASWLDVSRLAASAAHLADAEAALAWTADLAWQGRAIAGDDEVRVDAAGLPRELQRRLLRAALVRLGARPDLRGPDIERLLDRLLAGKTATLVDIRAIGGAIWRFSVAPPRRSGAPGS